MKWIVLALIISLSGDERIEAAPNGRVFYDRAECEAELPALRRHNVGNPRNPVFWCQPVVPASEST